MSKKLRPCIKCGSKTDAKVWDCGHSSFNVGGVICKCGNEVKVEPCDCYPTDELIRVWNVANPTPEIYIGQKSDEIIKLKNKIKAKKKEITRVQRLFKV